MADEDKCTYQLLYMLQDQAARCQYVKENCGDKYAVFNMIEFSYCGLKENYWLIIPIYVDRL